MTQQPLWKSVLDKSFEENINQNAFVQMATVTTEGRPSVRTVVFRGFWSHPSAISSAAASTSAPTVLSTSGSSSSVLSSSGGGNASHAPQSNLISSKLSSLLTFCTDVRSGKLKCRTADLAFHSHVQSTEADGLLTELCWYFPITREQYRLSGRTYSICSPTHPKSTSLHPPWADPTTIPQLTFESARLDLWTRLTPIMRAHFASKLSPGELVPEETKVEDVTPLPCLLEGTPERAAASPEEVERHDYALENFVLLLVDVERVDHLDLKGKGELGGGGMVRFVYEVKVPERAFNRIAGLQWSVTRVAP